MQQICTFKVVYGRRGALVKTVRVMKVADGDAAAPNLQVILEQAELAESFLRRLKGLLGRKELTPGLGMVIRPCRSIHTLGMAFPIDVGFVDESGRLCLLVERLPPGKLGVRAREARYVIEAPAGTFAAAGVKQGDQVALVELAEEGNNR